MWNNPITTGVASITAGAGLAFWKLHGDFYKKYKPARCKWYVQHHGKLSQTESESNGLRMHNVTPYTGRLRRRIEALRWFTGPNDEMRQMRERLDQIERALNGGPRDNRMTGLKHDWIIALEDNGVDICEKAQNISNIIEEVIRNVQEPLENDYGATNQYAEDVEAFKEQYEKLIAPDAVNPALNTQAIRREFGDAERRVGQWISSYPMEYEARRNFRDIAFVNGCTDILARHLLPHREALLLGNRPGDDDMNAAIVLFSAMMRQRYPPGTMYLAQPLVYENADPRPGDEGGALAGGVRKDQQQPRPAAPAQPPFPGLAGGMWEWDREDTPFQDPIAPRALQLPIVYSKQWTWVYKPLGHDDENAPPAGRGRGGRGVGAPVVDEVFARLRVR